MNTSYMHGMVLSAVLEQKVSNPPVLKKDIISQILSLPLIHLNWQTKEFLLAKFQSLLSNSPPTPPPKSTLIHPVLSGRSLLPKETFQSKGKAVETMGFAPLGERLDLGLLFRGQEFQKAQRGGERIAPIKSSGKLLSRWNDQPANIFPLEPRVMTSRLPCSCLHCRRAARSWCFLFHSCLLGTKRNNVM